MRTIDSITKIAVCLTVWYLVGFSDACDSGWFGDTCQYMCHCAEGAQCDDDGSCSSGCDDNWFGPACQYDSVGYKTGTSYAPPWLSDKDDTTCNDGTVSRIYTSLNTPIPLTWIRIVVSDEANIDEVMLFYLPNDKKQFLRCPDSRRAKVRDRTFDITCRTIDSASQITLEGVRNLCSLYISGGRNIALKQSVAQSSRFENWSPYRWLASYAVNGDTGITGDPASTCTHTNPSRSRGYWILSFSSSLGVDITRFLIYNRAGCCKERLQGFKLTARSTSSADTTYIYTDPGGSPQVMYTVIPSPKISFPVKSIRVDVSDTGTNKILSLCEFLTFGEEECGANKFGLGCENSCNCKDQSERCFVHSGGCQSGCALDYTGENCLVKKCIPGRYGRDCQETCSAKCGGIHNECYPKDGACTRGCVAGYTGRFCENQCQKGSFGFDCSEKCNINCRGSDNACHHITGVCNDGCNDGYRGDMCDIACTVGKYGRGCSQSCSANCGGLDNYCDPIDGKCSNGCDDGYRGEKCENTCTAGRYGPECKNTCNINCAGSDNDCEHVSGMCKYGCDGGYRGDTCLTKCSIGKYGQECKESCSDNCRGFSKECNHINGTCTYGCRDGYQPPKCDTVCTDGSYGSGCSKSCSTGCKGSDNACHHITGTCKHGCEDGYQGEMCSDYCSIGMYGPGCNKSCSVHCFGPDNECDHIDGTCSCDDGYRGSKCDQECGRGYYGPGCRSRCISRCKDSVCNNVNGACSRGCLVGYRGEKCTEKCELGKYGVDCKENCSVHCAGDGDPCDHITGTCDNRCDPGYRWNKCIHECAAGRYGDRCLQYCSVYCAGQRDACYHVDGTCDEGCDSGYTGRTCVKKCDMGYYGEGCKERCSKNCAGDGNSCNHITGKCDLGCVPGYRGDTCSQVCQAGRYGTKCSKYCSRFCEGPDHACHHVQGTCDVCRAGYRGSKCELRCITGFYGDGCGSNCSEHCAGPDNSCHHVNGVCDGGCDPGYHGHFCVNECNHTTWGQECAMNCSIRCQDKDCHHETGLCGACYGGYWGGLCDKQCNETTFGADCAQLCSVNCGLQQCHHVTGVCETCTENRIGDFCEKLKPTQDGGDDSTMGAVVGVLLFVLLALAIVAGVFYWRHRKAKQQASQEENGVGMKESASGTTYANMAPGTSNEKKSGNQSKGAKPVRTFTTRRKDGFEDESEEDSDNEMAGNVQAPVLAGDTAVPVYTLKAYILQHSADTHFKDEFTSIPMANSSPQTCGLSAENTKKNRYKNIIPYDASRVLLTVQGGKKHSDYINASYVKGYQSDAAFIASQGPNDFILNDFVRMLWEQKIDRVVMLTNLVELGKKKCSMYWPADGEEEFGEVTVRLLTTHVYAEYTIRQLRLSKNGETSRNLTQFHFTAWPDKSVPESPWGLVDLHQRVVASQGSGPLLVHCSAGVGRTGTFIGLCNLLQEAEATGKMDFRSTLWKLRQDRMHTIQTIAQYAYLHKVAYVGYMTAGTTTKVKDMYACLDSLERGSQRSYKKEFEAVLEACAATTIKSNETAEEPEENVYQNTGGPPIKGKDRLSNILPNKAYRPLLTAEAHHEDTYINAVMVPNLVKDSHDVLTQLPLPSTVTDFWRLVTQHSVGLVVAFDTDSRHTDETIAEFFPTSESEPFENDRFKVVTKPPTDSRLAKEFFLTVHQKIVPGMDSLSSEKKRTLTLLLCKSAQLLELDPQSVMELQESIKQRRPGGRSRTVFMCRNGADQSGLMCVQSILLDRLETDQCLAVPLVVGTIKAIRPQAIPTVEQYKCLYRVLKLAHESQNVYGNVGDMPGAS